MITPRPSGERGHFNFGWLDTFHTFSFGEYHDPRHMGFRALRVINEDRVAPGAGFPTHPHRDMEILTYILEGALEHKDSMGNGSVIRAGEVQYMSAGTGVTHSEYNPSPKEGVHLLQIWILPGEEGARPRYGQRAFPKAERRGRLRLLASPDGREDSLSIRQDAFLHGTLLEPGRSVAHSFAPGRHGWIQVARGALAVGDQKLSAGDGAAISNEGAVEFKAFKALEAAEVLLFDLA